MLTFWVHIDIQYCTPFHVVCTVSLNIYKSIFLQDIAWYDILAVIWIFSYILEDFRYNMLKVLLFELLLLNNLLINETARIFQSLVFLVIYDP
jgi:hypothetical protein